MSVRMMPGDGGRRDAEESVDNIVVWMASELTRASKGWSEKEGAGFVTTADR